MRERHVPRSSGRTGAFGRRRGFGGAGPRQASSCVRAGARRRLGAVEADRLSHADRAAAMCSRTTTRPTLERKGTTRRRGVGPPFRLPGRARTRRPAAAISGATPTVQAADDLEYTGWGGLRSASRRNRSARGNSSRAAPWRWGDPRAPPPRPGEPRCQSSATARAGSGTPRRGGGRARGAAGSSTSQCPLWNRGHLGWNTQACGGSIGDGTSPLSTMRWRGSVPVRGEPPTAVRLCMDASVRRRSARCRRSRPAVRGT